MWASRQAPREGTGPSLLGSGQLSRGLALWGLFPRCQRKLAPLGRGWGAHLVESAALPQSGRGFCRAAMPSWVFLSLSFLFILFSFGAASGCEKQVSLPGHSLLDGTIVRARDSSWAEQFSAGPFSAQSGWYWIRGVFQMGSDRFSGLRLTSHFRKFRSAFCSFWMMERLLCFVNFVNILITHVHYTSLFPTYSVITCVTGWSFYIDLFNFNENFKKRSLSRSISPKAGRESHGGAAERPAAEERREGPPRRRPRGDGPEGGTGQWSGLPPVGR